ncbi:hypothetical protein Droror1_Dr00007447 [Drosera rotundifolia]
MLLLFSHVPPFSIHFPESSIIHLSGTRILSVCPLWLRLCCAADERKMTAMLLLSLGDSFADNVLASTKTSFVSVATFENTVPIPNCSIFLYPLFYVQLQLVVYLLKLRCGNL